MDANKDVRTVAGQHGALDETALAPCPHCGENLVEHTDRHGSWWAHRNEPANCAHGVTQLFDAEDIEQWNRRASPSQVAPANLTQVTDAIRSIVEDALNSAIPEPWEVAEHATQRILAAIGAGGQAVAEDIETQAWECDKWPAWLDAIVERTNDVADRLDMSSEQAHAYAILSALSQPHPADERVVEALQIGRSYVLDAMRNDGGIENCEIGYRTDYEKIHSALAALSTTEGRKNG